MSPTFELVDERETDAGWTWTAQVLDDEGAMRRRDIRLAWADYDLWCEGRTSPADVAEAALGYLMAHAAELAERERVDLAWCRRVREDADAEIPGLIR